MDFILQRALEIRTMASSSVKNAAKDEPRFSLTSPGCGNLSSKRALASDAMTTLGDIWSRICLQVALNCFQAGPTIPIADQP
jgi:hypothetical protein